jgi:hypothetical protein
MHINIYICICRMHLHNKILFNYSSSGRRVDDLQIHIFIELYVDMDIHMLIDMSKHIYVYAFMCTHIYLNMYT